MGRLGLGPLAGARAGRRRRAHRRGRRGRCGQAQPGVLLGLHRGLRPVAVQRGVVGRARLQVARPARSGRLLRPRPRGPSAAAARRLQTPPPADESGAARRALPASRPATSRWVALVRIRTRAARRRMVHLPRVFCRVFDRLFVSAPFPSRRRVRGAPSHSGADFGRRWTDADRGGAGGWRSPNTSESWRHAWLRRCRFAGGRR